MTTIAHIASLPSMVALRKDLLAHLDSIIEEAIRIQQIPGPTFDEGQRARYVAERFKALENVEIDDVHNVYGCLRGEDSSQPAVLVSAHTDTVFEASTSLAIERHNGRIYGPGLGDNSLGVAAVLALADLLREGVASGSLSLPSDIWFVANSREEGMGDLGGIRAAHKKLARDLGSALVVEGIAYGRVYHSGIAVRRLRITCRTAGGHSWLHFGRPSAIHGLIRLGNLITTLRPPESPRTTYNIGVIEGGRSVNSIAAEASMLLDMRSEERDALEKIERTILALIDECRTPDMEFAVEVVGDRPSGAIPVAHPIVQMAREALETLGMRAEFETGSTDANVLLAAGLPTITIGITYGGNAHRLDEYIETGQIADGMWQLALLAVGASMGLAR